MKKYTFTGKKMTFAGEKLNQIVASCDIPKWGVKEGDIGGWIKSENNLAHNGNGWVSEDAKVYDNAIVVNGHVYGESVLYGEALLNSGEVEDGMLYGNTHVSGDVKILNSRISNCNMLGKGTFQDSFFENVYFSEDSMCRLNNVHISVKSGLSVKSHLEGLDCQIILDVGQISNRLSMQNVTIEVGEFSIGQRTSLRFARIVSPYIGARRSVFKTVDYTTTGVGSVVIEGESDENPIVLEPVELIFSETTLEGSVRLSGFVRLHNTLLRDFAEVHMRGKMHDCVLIDCAKLSGHLHQDHSFEGLRLSGDERHEV